MPPYRTITSNEEPLNDIKDIIENGLVKDLFQAERANYLIQAINERVQDVNDTSRWNFGIFFGTIQSYTINELILSISRIYDQRKKSFETRCLDALLQKLDMIKENPPKIQQYNQLYEYLESNKIYDLLMCIDNDKDFIADLFNYIRANHNNNQKIICSLKSWRDKKIAHNDKFIVKEVSSLTLKDCHLLLEFPKKVITIIGWAYLNTGYGVKNDYFLSSDSKRSSIALKRLISKLY